MYLIKKVINNNVLVAENSKFQEFVIMGKGIGFKNKKGEMITQDVVEKKFLLSQDSQVTTKEAFEEFLNTIEQDVFNVVVQLSEVIAHDLNVDYSGYSFYNLLDHISAMVQRVNNNLEIAPAIDKEILDLYPEHKKTATNCYQILVDRLGIKKSQHEIDILCIHLINATQDATFNTLTTKTNKIMLQVVNVIKQNSKFTIDDQNFYYSRFLIHLKFFILRHQQQKLTNNEENDLLEITKSNYFEAYVCVEEICLLLKNEYQWKISDNEKLYLLIHIVKLIKN